jgi:hypothetical protein
LYRLVSPRTDTAAAGLEFLAETPSPNPDSLPLVARLFVTVLLAMLVPATAVAQQVFESVGSRALGMAGAFVAVADDATAVYWNPAGLAAGGPAGATIEWTRFRTGDQHGPPVPGPTSRGSSLFSLGTWPIGLSYARLQATDLSASPGGTVAETLQTTQFGATIVQQAARGVVVGSTLKYVSGMVAGQLAQGRTAQDALTSAGRLTARTSGRFDLDVGLMVDMDKVRVGLTARNLRSPAFPGIAGDTVVLKRQSRIGVAVLPTHGLTLAMDLDLTKLDLREGFRRMIAFGGEGHLGARLAVRAGVRWSLVGPRGQVAALGASLALKPNFWIDGHFTQGHLDGDRGFGVGLRAGLK